MPVSAVVWGGRDTVSSGSSTAQRGIRHRSLTAYLWWSAPVTTAAMVVSEPVPAVVGTAMKGEMGRRTFRSPAIWASVLWGRASRAAAALAASMGLPPPTATKLSHCCARYRAAMASASATGGFGVTPV